jgi:hypothetical protein
MGESMDRDQAANIQKLIFSIEDSIAKIEEIILECPREERSYFAEGIGELTETLRFNILERIYHRFPELRASDSEEVPHVSSYLQWKDVTLPKSITASDLDAIILAVLKYHWLKTARIISDAAARFQDRFESVDLEIIGARIQVLADEGRIEAQGDVSKWRHSEVRLRQGASAENQDGT